jgi:hypothetical protein
VNYTRIAIVVVAAALIAVAGCAAPAGKSVTGQSAAGTSAAETQPAVASRGRTQMWAENCNRCHNARPASWYSRREWAVAMHHMQVRGYLTGAETRGVTEFFGAAGK